MKALRRLVFANALLLAAAGVTIAFNPPLSLPVRYAVGWGLTLIVLAMVAALLWMARRPLRPEEVAAGIEALSISDEIRQGLLRQIGEAAAQEERNRLARDLHDSIKQQLFSINVGAAAAQERWDRDPEGARKALADVRRSAREAMVEMQAMLHQLRPEALGTAGLIEALREQCEALGYRTGAEVALELGDPLPEDRMPPGAPETLFRMAQEMLSNVARHARARSVRLWLGRQEDAVILRIEDDGQGFEPATATSGMGLRNLRERAAALRGTVEIASAPGTGTRVVVRIPLIPLPTSQPVDVTRLELLDVIYQVVVFAGFFLFSHYLYSHRDLAAWPFEILMVLILISGWPLGRRRSRMEPHVQEYLRKQGRILIIPMFLWASSMGAGKNLSLQGWRIEDLFLLGAVGATLFLIGASGWAAFQRASEARRFWRKGSRPWLALVLLTEAGIALAAGSSWLAPERLTLNPLEILSLLTLGIAIVYVASRQMRLEGACP